MCLYTFQIDRILYFRPRIGNKILTKEVTRSTPTGFTEFFFIKPCKKFLRGWFKEVCLLNPSALKIFQFFWKMKNWNMFLFAMKSRCLTLSPLLIKKILLIYPSPPPSPPQPRLWKIHAYLLSLPGWAWVISNRKRLANNMKAFIGLLLNWCVLFLLTGLGGLWDPEKSLVLRWLCSSLSC